MIEGKIGDSSEVFRAPGRGDVFKILLVPGIVLFLASCLLAADRSIWIDEGMFLANLHQPWIDYFKPLPFYDQASPPLASAVIAWVLEVSGNDLYAVRIFLISAVLGSIMYFGWEASRTYRLPLAVTAMLCLLVNGFVVKYATEVKHYAIEGVVSLILIGFYLRSLRRSKDDTMSAYIFLIFGAVFSFFSYGAVLATGTLMLDRALFSGDSRISRRWWAALLGFIGFYGLMYFFLFKGLVFFQLHNYSIDYVPYLLKGNFSSIPFWQHTRKILHELFMGWHLFRFHTVSFIAGLVVMALAWRHLVRDDYAPVRLLLILTGAVLLLSGLGFYPLAKGRQLLFCLPFAALVVGWAVQYLIDSGRRFTYAAAVLMVLGLLPSGVGTTLNAYAGVFDTEKTKELYQYVAGSPEKYILISSGFQPTFEFYDLENKLRDKVVLGKVNRESGPIPSVEETLSNYSAVIESRGGWASGTHLATEARSDLGAEWLISKAPANQTALLALSFIDARTEKELDRFLAKRGCQSEMVFQERKVKALRLTCPD